MKNLYDAPEPVMREYAANAHDPRRNVLHYFHVHDGKGSHGDGETYSIVLACDEHEPAVAARTDAEYIATSDADDEQCDLCPKSEEP